MTGWLSSLLELFDRGGPVMWPLLILSLISVAMSIERFWYWLRQRVSMQLRTADQLAAMLRSGDAAGIRKVSRAKSALLDRAALDFLELRPSPELAMQVAERFRPEFERFSAAMSTIVTAAPLLGILGTVLGIIQSFDLLGSAESVTDVGAVAAGIAEALLTTAFGLIVALATLFPHMYFRAKADRMMGLMESLAAARNSSAT